MKHFHRIAAGLTACAMLLSGAALLPELAADYSITASAEDTYTEGTYDVLTYQNYGDYILITDCDTSSVDVEIPGEIDGVPVTSIGNSAFSSCTSLTSVTIPDSVTSIGDWAFYSCTSLTSVTIPDSVTSIGDRAFRDCASLTSVTIPDSVTSIGVDAFDDCTSLTSVTIPDSVTSIGDRAFYGCTSLTSVTISDSVTSIGDCVFGCCESLTEINVADGNTSYTDIDGVLYNADCTELVAYPAGRGTAYMIPDGVTSIGDWAFYSCESLTSVTIPDSMTSIGNHAFEGCTSLTSVIIPDSVTSIGAYAFYECISLISVTIPDSVKSIYSYTFKGCTSLISVTIPDSVKYIGDWAFGYCANLISVTIPDGVTYIKDGTFYNCESLSSVTIPDSVTEIRDGAFSNCTNLTDVYYSGTEEEWNSIFIVYYYYNYAEQCEEWHYISIGSGNGILGGVTIHFNSTGPALYGDIDGDGEVTIVDVIELSQSLMGSGTLTAQGAANADVDQNGSINSTDTLYIVQYLVKLLPSLPV